MCCVTFAQTSFIFNPVDTLLTRHPDNSSVTISILVFLFVGGGDPTSIPCLDSLLLRSSQLSANSPPCLTGSITPQRLITRLWWTLSHLSLHLPDSQSAFYSSLNFRHFLSAHRSIPPHKSSLYDDLKNMLACNLSVPLIKALAVMGVPPVHRGRRVLPVLLSCGGEVNRFQGLVWCLRDCFGVSERHPRL